MTRQLSVQTKKRVSAACFTGMKAETFESSMPLGYPDNLDRMSRFSIDLYRFGWLAVSTHASHEDHIQRLPTRAPRVDLGIALGYAPGTRCAVSGYMAVSALHKVLSWLRD
jgi:hypothetical protein